MAFDSMTAWVLAKQEGALYRLAPMQKAWQKLGNLSAHSGEAIMLCLIALGRPFQALLQRALPAPGSGSAFFFGASWVPVSLLYTNYPIWALVGLAGAVIRLVPINEKVPRLQAQLTTLCCVFAVWSALSSLWSPLPGIALESVGQTLIFGLLGLYLAFHIARVPAPILRAFFAGLALGAIATAILYLLDYALGGPLANSWATTERGNAVWGVYARGHSVIAFLIWPLAYLYATRRFHLCWLLPLSFGITLLPFGNLAALLAVILGAVLALLAGWRAWVGWLAALAATSFSFFLMPLLGGFLKSLGWQEAAWMPFTARLRVAMWDYAGGKLAERPFFGWGAEASRYLAEESRSANGAGEQVFYHHPHQGSLQLWLELGLPGLLIFLFAVLCLLHTSLKHKALARAMIFGLFGAWLAVFMTSYGIWRARWTCSYLLALIAMVGALALKPAQAQAVPR